MPVLAPERPTTDRTEGFREELPPLFRSRRHRAGRRPVRAARRGLLRSAAAIVVALLALVGVARIGDLIPSLSNPFKESTVDRTGPAVLKAIVDIDEYRAASGDFQVIVDLEKDTKYVPSILKGERTLFVAYGSVDATVDFSNLGPGAVTVSDDRRAATITVPRAALSPARVDASKSYVADRDRGLLDRIGSVFSDSPTSERALFKVAERTIADAASADDGLRLRGEENTRKMLTALATSLGFTTVTVNFTEL